jgi:hypothetical protein
MNTVFFERQHLSMEGVSLYVDALALKQTEKIPEAVRLHVEQCDECKVQIMSAFELVKDEPYFAAQPHPYFDTQVHKPSVRYAAYKIAAGFAVAALVGGGYYFYSNNHIVTPFADQKITTPSLMKIETPAIAKKQELKNESSKLLAENFEVSPNLEDLVQNQFRSSSIEAVSPVVGKVTDQPIVFKWKDADSPLTIKVLTNKELTIESAVVNGRQYTLKKNLTPGMYYWKLETEDELLFVGKFIVK